MTLTSLSPETIPDVITALLSTDTKAVDKTEKDVQQLIDEAGKGTPDYKYLSNISLVIQGKVADIKNLQARLQKKAEDFDSINEEGVLVGGTLLTALTQTGNLTSLAVYSGGIAGAIKIGFSILKWRYKISQGNKLAVGTNETMVKAAEEGQSIYKEAFPTAATSQLDDSTKLGLLKKARMHADSII